MLTCARPHWLSSLYEKNVSHINLSNLIQNLSYRGPDALFYSSYLSQNILSEIFCSEHDPCNVRHVSILYFHLIN